MGVGIGLQKIWETLVARLPAPWEGVADPVKMRSSHTCYRIKFAKFGR